MLRRIISWPPSSPSTGVCSLSSHLSLTVGGPVMAFYSILFWQERRDFSDVIKVLSIGLWVNQAGDYPGWTWLNQVSLLMEGPGPPWREPCKVREILLPGLKKQTVLSWEAYEYSGTTGASRSWQAAPAEDQQEEGSSVLSPQGAEFCQLSLEEVSRPPRST